MTAKRGMAEEVSLHTYTSHIGASTESARIWEWGMSNECNFAIHLFERFDNVLRLGDYTRILCIICEFACD